MTLLKTKLTTNTKKLAVFSLAVAMVITYIVPVRTVKSSVGWRESKGAYNI